MRHCGLYAAVIAICLGCKSPAWGPYCPPGTKVPPPGTGTYGPPAAPYYQPAQQSVRPLTSTTPWTTVRDEQVASATLAPAKSGSTSTEVTVQPRRSAPTTLAPVSSATSSSRLNGLPVNEVRTAEPPTFVPEGRVNMVPRDGGAQVGTGVRAVQPASATQPQSSSSSVSGAVWQTRDEPSR
jgi:hypothetical protein